MPNIEIHGLDEGAAINKWKAIGIIIKREAPELHKIAVVTICNDTCREMYFNSDDPQPYLRICSTDSSQIDKLKAILAPLKMDIETLEIKEFIPAKK